MLVGQTEIVIIDTRFDRGRGLSQTASEIDDPSTSNVDAARSTASQFLFSCTQAGGPDFFLS